MIKTALQIKCSAVLIVFQQFVRRNVQTFRDFEKSLKGNSPNGSGTFYLREKVYALSDLLRKNLLRISRLLSVVSDFQP